MELVLTLFTTLINEFDQSPSSGLVNSESLPHTFLVTSSPRTGAGRRREPPYRRLRQSEGDRRAGQLHRSHEHGVEQVDKHRRRH
jgi:hypothetical protein